MGLNFCKIVTIFSIYKQLLFMVESLRKMLRIESKQTSWSGMLLKFYLEKLMNLKGQFY